MAWFYLYDSDITATVSASAEISSSDNDSAVVKVTASGYIPAGYWIYSTGVVVTITINGQPYTTTLFGNGSYYYGSDGAKTATFSVDVPKGTGAKNVAWSVAFKRAMDGYVYDTAHTATGTIAVGALPSYTVSYNANGGSGAPSAQTKWYGSTLKLSTATPTRTGYSFLGWSTANDSSVEYAAGANYTANSGVTLYAVWKANTYTVSYNANGGTGAPGNQTKTYGVNLTLSSTKPTRTNYNFLGWATSASATTAQYAAGGTYSANSGVTLYAVWQLAYTKPRINGLSVERCDADGNALEEGTYARVSFAWDTDRTVSSITVTWTSVMGGSGSTNIPASGTSDNVSFVFGGGNLSADATYTIAVSVADSGGSTPASTTLSSIKYTIDFLAGGKGAAFGKAAEKENTLDSIWTIYARAGFEYPVIPNNTDLNELLTPNVYSGLNASDSGYINCPITSGTFTLEVFPAGGNGQIMQLLTLCEKNKGEALVRHYYGGSWGVWRTFLSTSNYQNHIKNLDGTRFVNGWIGLYGSFADSYANTNRKGWIGHDGGTNFWMRNQAGGDIILMTQSRGVQLSQNAASFMPTSNGGAYLGTSNNNWSAVYSTNGTIQTSDRNLKTEIEPVDQKYLDLFDKLEPVTFKLAGKEHDRTHVGFISQDVKAAMDEVGLTPDDFAAYCRDEKTETIEVDETVKREDGTEEVVKSTKTVPVLDKDGNPEYLYSLRYSEFIALNTRMIQENRKKITALEEENAKLKERLAKIEAMLGIE